VTFLLYVTGLLFIGAIASFVASPLFTSGAPQEPHVPLDNEFARWEKQKTDAYSVLKEAAFDLQMGKLTQEDYLILREKYEAQALEALTQLDRISGALRLHDT